MDEHDVCQVFAKLLRDEHSQWDATMQEIDRLLPDHHKPADVACRKNELCSQLRTLRGELCHHFLQESQGGCIEEAVCRCPRLSNEAQRIEHEHPRILARLDEIIAVASNRNGSKNLGNLCRQFNKRLVALEDAECRVIQYGLNVNLDLNA